jgi:hypothetical protein
VKYEVRVAAAADAIKSTLSNNGYGLLVIGKHREGHSQVSAEEYQLVHAVRDIPVLAL